MPDSSALRLALVGRLLNDPLLMSDAVDGVWLDVAPQGLKQFVIVKLMAASDVGMFGGRAAENRIYLVKYVEQSKGTLRADRAAHRIDQLLDWAVLNAEGYSPVTVRRSEAIEYSDVDEANRDWQHRGGLYEL